MRLWGPRADTSNRGRELQRLVVLLWLDMGIEEKAEAMTKKVAKHATCAYVEIIDEFVDNAAGAGATEAHHDPLGLLQHEGHVAHHVGQAG